MHGIVVCGIRGIQWRYRNSCNRYSSMSWATERTSQKWSRWIVPCPCMSLMCARWCLLLSKMWSTRSCDERYLTRWVGLCLFTGASVGHTMLALASFPVSQNKTMSCKTNFALNWRRNVGAFVKESKNSHGWSFDSEGDFILPEIDSNASMQNGWGGIPTT